MKTTTWIATIAFPLCFTACEKPKEITLPFNPETAREKMTAGAEKFAEGVKEMTDQAKVEASGHLEKLKQEAKDAGANALDEASKAAQEAADKLHSTPAEQ